MKLEINLFIVSAGMQANPTATGCVPLTVNFGNSSVNATQYFWDFGNGSTSTAFEPTYTFTDTGTFYVMLIASDPTACVPIDTAYSTVIVYNTLVSAQYTTNITDYCDSLVVDFSSVSSGTATSQLGFRRWNNWFGCNVSHTIRYPDLYRNHDC